MLKLALIPMDMYVAMYDMLSTGIDEKTSRMGGE